MREPSPIRATAPRQIVKRGHHILFGRFPAASLKFLSGRQGRGGYYVFIFWRRFCVASKLPCR